METIKTNFDWAMAFLAVVEEGGFTRAAERLGSSKANASKQVKALEDVLGVKLLHRSARRMQLTEAGETYFQYCQRLAALFSEADCAIRNTHAEVTGVVKMSAPTTFGVEHLTGFLESLHAEYPRLEVELDVSTASRDLIATRHDLAIRSMRVIEPRLIAKSLGVWHDWLVASPAFLQKNIPLGDVQDLPKLPCLYNSHMADDQLWTLSKDGHSVSLHINHWLKLNNYIMLRNATLRGLGIARLPVYMVAKDVRAGLLRRLFPEYELPVKPVYLVFPDQRPLPRKVRVTVDHFAAWYGSMDFNA